MLPVGPGRAPFARSALAGRAGRVANDRLTAGPDRSSRFRRPGAGAGADPADAPDALPFKRSNPRFQRLIRRRLFETLTPEITALCKAGRADCSGPRFSVFSRTVTDVARAGVANGADQPFRARKTNKFTSF